jgi:hypothetical protein
MKLAEALDGGHVDRALEQPWLKEKNTTELLEQQA